ncbi:LysR family transcriptional regulator [Thalassospira lucentensis]|uniref:LysR family transcriptional regulator n=1 Tax=Thalassospira lucentensis TaxID=168935 RepID=UPI002942D65B|nr:LysR family transcriptional regulator [Thalassospira lucentensis]WOI11895.1 LysR family transcriptional regulator [Thalassospira lucentensis]
MHKSGLTELEAIIAVARRGSFRAAAHELGMSPTALSNAVAALEKRLDVRLFNRTTRSVSLTEAGDRFIARIAPAVSEIDQAVENINAHRNTPVGRLRINSFALAARVVLKPIILEYMRRYPDMKVDIVTEGRFVDIVAEGFDGGFRLTEEVPRDMIAVPAGPEMSFAVVGAPSYFAARERPQTPDDLLNHECIRSRLGSGAIYHWDFRYKDKIRSIDVPGQLCLDEGELLLQAARAGAGLANLPLWLVEDDIRTGRLIRVLEEWSISYSRLAFYYPSRKNISAGLRAFVSLLREIEAKSRHGKP